MAKPKKERNPRVTIAQLREELADATGLTTRWRASCEKLEVKDCDLRKRWSAVLRSTTLSPYGDYNRGPASWEEIFFKVGEISSIAESKSVDRKVRELETRLFALENPGKPDPVRID